MSFTHQSLQTNPIDFYQLSLFRLLYKHRNFTKAALEAGLTQSAVTRSISNLEGLLETRLFERTTRKVEATPAGDFLENEAKRLLGDLDFSMRTLKEEYAGKKVRLRIAISESICNAHLYGLLPNMNDHNLNVKYVIMSVDDHEILTTLTSKDCDIGICDLPHRLSSKIKLLHQFEDAFTVIAHERFLKEFDTASTDSATLMKEISQLPWLMLPETTDIGKSLRDWMKSNGLNVEPTMEISDFDRMTHLVTLGFGIAAVPLRALAQHKQKRKLRRIKLPKTFKRRIGVVGRNQRDIPPVIKDFIDGILFRGK